MSFLDVIGLRGFTIWKKFIIAFSFIVIFYKIATRFSFLSLKYQSLISAGKTGAIKRKMENIVLTLALLFVQGNDVSQLTVYRICLTRADFFIGAWWNGDHFLPVHI